MLKAADPMMRAREWEEEVVRIEERMAGMTKEAKLEGEMLKTIRLADRYLYLVPIKPSNQSDEIRYPSHL